MEREGRRSAPPAPSTYQPKHALDEPPRRDITNYWLWLLLILVSGFVAGTTAAFTASTTDSGNTFGSASLSNPTTQTLTLAGTNLTMAVSANGAVDGGGASVGVRWRYYYPTGVSNAGSSPTCATTASSYTADAGRNNTLSLQIDHTTLTGFADGRWACVMAHTAYPAEASGGTTNQWLSQNNNPRNAVQMGHVVQSVALNDVAGTAGTIQRNDRIVITFNQTVDATSRPSSGRVCSRAANDRIYVAPTDATCSDTETNVDMLYLEPEPGVTIANDRAWTSTTWSWSGRVLTITLNTNTSTSIGGCAANQTCFRAHTDLSANPSTALEAGTGGTARALCTTDDADPDNGVCWPYATGRF